MSAESVLCTSYPVSLPLILCALIVSVMMTSCMVMLLVSVAMMPLKGAALTFYFDFVNMFEFGSAI